MIVTTLLALWLTMVIAPATPIGRSLRRMTVEAPAHLFSQVTAGHIVLALILIGAVSGAVWVFDHDALRLMSMAAPDVIAWATMFEITTYLDALVAVVTAASALRLRGVIGRARNMVALVMTRIAPRGRARRSVRKPRGPAANDDDAHAMPLAA